MGTHDRGLKHPST